jgi:hypothetical protein
VAISVVTLAGGWGAGPAAAHSCATPSLVTVGRPAVFAIGVAAESVAVDHVNIIVPRQLRITDADHPEGWTVNRTDTSVDYTGGRIEPLGCLYFSLRGTPLARGTYVLPLKLHFVDGTERTFRGKELGSLDSGHVVFAGTTEEDAANAVPPKKSNVVQVAVIVAFAVVAVAVAFFAVRRALRPPAS